MACTRFIVDGRLGKSSIRRIDEVDMLALRQVEHKTGHQGAVGYMQSVYNSPVPVFAFKQIFDTFELRFTDIEDEPQHVVVLSEIRVGL